MKRIAGIKFVGDKVVYGSFPKVFKFVVDGKAWLEVIYEDHSETYNIGSRYNGQEGSKYSAEGEEEMCRGNGGRELHYNEFSESPIK